jgi:hypothetical protein
MWNFSTNYDSGGLNAFSISIWLKLTGAEFASAGSDSANVGETAVGVWGAAQPARWRLGYRNLAGLAFAWQVGNEPGITSLELFKANNPITNGWFHVACGYDGQGITGTPMIWWQTNAGPRNYDTNSMGAGGISLFQTGTNGVSAPYRIVGFGNLIDGTYAWRGQIDEFAYWNRTISTNEVAYLYGGGTNPGVFNPATWNNNWHYKWP